MDGWREILMARGPVGVLESVIDRLDALSHAYDALAQELRDLQQQQLTGSDTNGQSSTSSFGVCDGAVNDQDALDNGVRGLAGSEELPGGESDSASQYVGRQPSGGVPTGTVGVAA